jgi:hypothetical protein
MKQRFTSIGACGVIEVALLWPLKAHEPRNIYSPSRDCGHLCADNTFKGRAVSCFMVKFGRGPGLKGHRSILTAIGHRPNTYHALPSGGWDLSCECGWNGGNHIGKKTARRAYHDHIDDLLKNGLFHCKRCGHSKPLCEMRKDYRYMCLDCFSKSGNEWSKKNSAKSAIHKRRHHLMRKFGITLEEYDSLLAHQDNKCAICRGPLKDPRGHAPHIDHEHGTVKVRGILCHGCNNGLGNFADNPTALRNAALYIERSKLLTTKIPIYVSSNFALAAME